MVCYFCRNASATLVHDACKTTPTGLFSERTLCPKCGKCSKCDHAELQATVDRQRIAIMQISKRRYALIRLADHFGLSMISDGKGNYLGSHRSASFIEGCENLDWASANIRLADALYNPDSEWKHIVEY
jgi:hypothetical protein